MTDSKNETIECIASDGKLHACLPWESHTFCSDKLEVKNKKVKDNDRAQRFSCYECTF